MYDNNVLFQPDDDSSNSSSDSPGTPPPEREAKHNIVFKRPKTAATELAKPAHAIRDFGPLKSVHQPQHFDVEGEFQRPPCRQRDPSEAAALNDDAFVPVHHLRKEPEIKRPVIPTQFLSVFRPPSRHKTPPKALGLDLPDGPHTPPETQKELEEAQELSRTQQFQGLVLMNNSSKPNPDPDSDPDVEIIGEGTHPRRDSATAAARKAAAEYRSTPGHEAVHGKSAAHPMLFQQNRVPAKNQIAGGRLMVTGVPVRAWGDAAGCTKMPQQYLPAAEERCATQDGSQSRPLANSMKPSTAGQGVRLKDPRYLHPQSIHMMSTITAPDCKPSRGQNAQVLPERCMTALSKKQGMGSPQKPFEALFVKGVELTPGKDQQQQQMMVPVAPTAPPPTAGARPKGGVQM